MSVLELAPAEILHELNQRAVETRKAKLKSDIYWNDPVAFIMDFINWEELQKRSKFPLTKKLTTYQEEILSQLPSKKRVSVRSPHGAGKTTLAAFAVLWFANTRDGDDWKVPTTASVFRQLEKFLWPEIHKWSRLLKWNKLGRSHPYDSKLELQTRTLKLSTGEAFALSADQPEHLEGAHADHLLYVFDESKMIKPETWDAIEGAFSGTGETLVLSISTPGPPAGRFYEIQTKAHIPNGPYSDWWVRHVTLQDTIDNGRVSQTWAEQRKRQWGVNSSLYKNRVLGEFADSEGDVVIPLSFIQLAQDRYKEWQQQVENGEVQKYGRLTSIGIDVGREGADPNAYALRNDNVLIEVKTDNHKDTMLLVKESKKLLDRYGGIGIVDVIGVGGGPFDRLRELRCNVMSFNSSVSTRFTDLSGELGFVNVRAASWWHLRELLDPLNGYDICLPLDEELTQELITPMRKHIDAGGRIAIESKKDIRERLGRSTNKGDAVVQAFALEVLDNQYGDYEVWGGAVSDDISDEMIRQSEEEIARIEHEAAQEVLRETIDYEGAYFPAGEYL